MKVDSSPPPQRSPKTRSRRRWLIAASVLGVALLLIAALIRFFPDWNQNRLIRRARISMEWKDYVGARLTARRALQLNDRSVPALTILAELAEKQQSGQSLYWRRRLVELQPANEEARLTLAEQALVLRKALLAKDALEGVSDHAKESARYHHVAGQLALALGQKPVAEAEFARAVQGDSANTDYQIELASLRIQSEEETIRDQARQLLDGLFQQPATLARAAPALIADALKRKDYDRAIFVANSMRQRDGASWDDSLYYLQLLHELKHPGYPALLTELQEKAADDPERVSALVSSMTSNHSALLAVHWCKELSPEVVKTMPAPMALARAYAVLGDWTGLKPLVENSEEPSLQSGDDSPTAANPPSIRDWHSYEFMRLALLARALRAQGDTGEWRVMWSAAVKAASDRPVAIAILGKAAIDWKWEQESVELLWLVARGPSDQMWALDILYSTYTAARATRNMLQVATRMHEVDPTNALIRNNFAILSLLAQINVDQAGNLAEDLHKEEPGNPMYASTLAFARYIQGRTQEALELMRGLGEERLRQPEYAAYFGVMLAASGERDQAKEFLRLGSSGFLLPEERELLERAMTNSVR
jgi:predicted Zn-dependent protease